MKKIIMNKEEEATVCLEDVDERLPIFAKKHGKLVGMVVYEPYKYGCTTYGWILKTGRDFGATGHRATREECLLSCTPYGYEFFIEE